MRISPNRRRHLLGLLVRTTWIVFISVGFYFLLSALAQIAVAFWSLFFANVVYDSIIHVDVSSPEEDEDEEEEPAK